MEGPGRQTVKDHSPTKSYHPIARTIYLVFGIISSLLTVYFAMMFLAILVVPESADAKDALISRQTGFWVFLAGTVFFGLVGSRLIKLCEGLRAKAGGVLLWASGVGLALGTMYMVFERGVNPIGGMVIAIVGTVSVLCLWWGNKEPRK